MVTRVRTGFIGSLIAFSLVAAGSQARPESLGEEPKDHPPAIVCEVEGQAVIFSIIPDGSIVEEGQLVCELDPAPYKEKLTRRQFIVEAAEAASREARKTRETAEIAAAEYEKAIVKKDVATAEGEIKLAESDMSRSADRVGWARRMHEKGFVAKAQLVSEELNYQKARFSLEQAQSKLKVLQGYTKPRKLKELGSEIDRARFDERATIRYLEMEQARLAQIQTQIDRCRIFSPVAGKVVHVRLKGDPEGSEEGFPRPGKRVRQGEILAQDRALAGNQVPAVGSLCATAARATRNGAPAPPFADRGRNDDLVDSSRRRAR